MKFKNSTKHLTIKFFRNPIRCRVIVVIPKTRLLQITLWINEEMISWQWRYQAAWNRKVPVRWWGTRRISRKMKLYVFLYQSFIYIYSIYNTKHCAVIFLFRSYSDHLSCKALHIEREGASVYCGNHWHYLCRDPT